ncbi:hypothetical protein K4H00_26325, partial [Mycobacterium tuberculosis]|nr:hypothetical protein [Mycobacterium tuberculosis]
MSNNPFSLDRSGGLDMFGSSALSSGLGLDVTAFGGFDAIAANDDDPDPPPSSPSSARRAVAGTKPAPSSQGRRQGD